MAFSDFTTLEKVKKELGIKHIFEEIVFENVSMVAPSEKVLMDLKEGTMFLPVNEKAKSEAIIFPILKEVWRSNRDKIACFSGFTLETTHNKKLSGMCDYIFGHAPQSIELNAPAFCVVEAKNRTLEEGFGQCIAEMYAVELFNEERGNPIPVVYGLVTNAYEWIFLKYENKLATIDLNRYFSTNSDNLSHLLGVFQWIVDRI